MARTLEETTGTTGRASDDCAHVRDHARGPRHDHAHDHAHTLGHAHDGDEHGAHAHHAHHAH